MRFVCVFNVLMDYFAQDHWPQASSSPPLLTSGRDRDSLYVLGARLPSPHTKGSDRATQIHALPDPMATLHTHPGPGGRLVQALTQSLRECIRLGGLGRRQPHRRADLLLGRPVYLLRQTRWTDLGGG